MKVDSRIAASDRRAILAGYRHRIVYPALSCPLQAGDVVTLHPFVQLEVKRVAPDGPERIVVAFVLRDHRPRLLHRDSSHGYTHDRRLAMQAEPESVPAGFVDRDRVERGADQQDALLRARRRHEQSAADLQRRAARTSSDRGRRAMLRHIRASEAALAAA